MENCDLYLDEMFSKIWTWRVLILRMKPDFRKHSFFQHFLEKNRSNEVCIRLGFYTSLSKIFLNFTNVERFVCFSIHCSLTLSNWSKQQLIKLYKLIYREREGYVDIKSRGL